MGEFIRNRLPDAVSYFEKQGLALTGRSLWRTTRCDFHGGSDSMRVNTESGAWACMNCGAHGGDVLAYHMQAHGLEFVEAARALGAYFDDGKPHRGPVKPAGLPMRAAMEVMSSESLVLFVGLCNLVQGAVLSVDDLKRLAQAASRVYRLTEGVLGCE